MRTLLCLCVSSSSSVYVSLLYNTAHKHCAVNNSLITSCKRRCDFCSSPLKRLINIAIILFFFLATHSFFSHWLREKRKRHGPLCVVTHLLLSIILCMVLSQEPVCLCHRRAAEEDSLCSSSVVRARSSLFLVQRC